MYKIHHMEVNFNGLRKRLIADYNNLVEKLNSHIEEPILGETEIRVYPEYLQRELDGLRTGLVALAFTYQKGEDGFDCLDENTHFESFNPEPKD